MASRSFTRYVEEELGKFPYIVLYILLEWILIFILFLDGFLAFFANEFARFFELKIPCWLCTRFDHVMVNRNPDFYYNESICEGHKKDISHLAFCHNHKKLCDIRKMCEGCLLSFATEKESNCDTYKSLVGILHKDLECFVEDGQPIQLSLRDEGYMMNSSTQRCSCCGEPLKIKAPPPLPPSSSSYARVKNSGSFSQLSMLSSPRSNYPFKTSKDEDPHAHESPQVPYTELKFMSENGLEEEYGSNSKAQNNAKESEEEESQKFTPTFTKGNKFFGIPLTDPSNSPRWSYRIRKSPLEKTDNFSTDPNEGIVLHDLDDTILNNLKRQVRLDRKSLIDLYMELDEERSASAIAANNAMAMITRLQAEKAAVQMEALQYQRMMEEQAEYDEEAIQAQNEILLKREEEIKSLDAELEIYRNKYGSLGEEDFKQVNLFSNGGNNTPVTVTPIDADEGLNSNGEDGIKDLKGDRTYQFSRIKTMENRMSFEEIEVKSMQYSTSDSGNDLYNETGKRRQESLPNELSSLTERLKALEAKGELLEENSEETGILTQV